MSTIQLWISDLGLPNLQIVQSSSRTVCTIPFTNSHLIAVNDQDCIIFLRDVKPWSIVNIPKHGHEIIRLIARTVAHKLAFHVQDVLLQFCLDRQGESLQLRTVIHESGYTPHQHAVQNFTINGLGTDFVVMTWKRTFNACRIFLAATTFDSLSGAGAGTSCVRLALYQPAKQALLQSPCQ